ncbi:MAG: endolytic transglycosylase MltG [bacterium]|nr:endolytic transglycosylase MltG [bacterium]
MKKLLLIILLIFFTGWYVGNQWWWRSPSSGAEAVQFVIAEGSGVSIVADQLKKEKIIRSPILLKVYAKFTGQEDRVQVGDFELFKKMSAQSVLSIITNATASEVQVTLLEGWTLDDMGNYLDGLGVVSRAEWSKVATHDLEGYLFPDTYRFLKEVTAEEIVKRMREEMEEKITSAMRAEMDRRGINMHEVLTMASIIEREVRGDKDRRMVSDLFWRRLDIGMALQADSTVNYVTGGKNPSISFVDRDIDSPYNTYKYRGFPPGPISNPSLSSIEAAIYPESNDYFFFLTDPEGKVYYGRTLGEHSTNRALYLR